MWRKLNDQLRLKMGIDTKPNTIKKEKPTVLYNADPKCDHQIKSKWSGIECVKCGGWFCY